jgi:predicted ester cyclase
VIWACGSAYNFVEREEAPGFAPTKDGVLDMFRMYRTAFPDLQMHAEEVLVSGDKTVTRVRATGTHQGALMGALPGRRHTRCAHDRHLQFNDAGLVREHWGVMDMFSMMQQLGAIPEGPPA